MLLCLLGAKSAFADDAPSDLSSSATDSAKKLNWRPFRPSTAEWLTELNQDTAIKARAEQDAVANGEDPNARPQLKVVDTRRHDWHVHQAQKTGGDSVFDDPLDKKKAADAGPADSILGQPAAKAPADSQLPGPSAMPLEQETPTVPSRLPAARPSAPPSKTNPFVDEPAAKSPLGIPGAGASVSPYVPGGASQRAPTPLLPSASSEGCNQDGPGCEQELANLMANTVDKISLDISIHGTPGLTYPCECSLGNAKYSVRDWPCITYTWKATALCHKPLYFEQTQFERYGHSYGPIADSLISGAHFFVTVPLLPYEMGVYPPWECQYALGYYRPGDCAPHMIEPFPLSLRGLLVEGGVVTGAAFILTP